MLTSKTVFVIGAGASVPYGFSSGASLLAQARAMGTKHMAEVTAQEVKGTIAARLEEAVIETLEDSIDSMLEQRRELWLPGKRLIAGLLLKEERHVKQRRAHISPEIDWIAQVFRMMSSGANTLEKFLSNDVTFLTFNYDRLLEWRFLGGIRSRYGCDEDTCRKAVSAMQIIHLHGSIGPPWELGVDDSLLPIPFGAFADIEPHTEEPCLNIAMGHADRSIRIIHDAVPGGSEFVNARTHLAIAYRVAFLGFGFGRTNVNRLELGRIGETVPVVCSVYSMTDAEVRQRVRTPLVHITGSSFHALPGEITSVLRETADLFV